MKGCGVEREDWKGVGRARPVQVTGNVGPWLGGNNGCCFEGFFISLALANYSTWVWISQATNPSVHETLPVPRFLSRFPFHTSVGT